MRTCTRDTCLEGLCVGAPVICDDALFCNGVRAVTRSMAVRPGRPPGSRMASRAPSTAAMRRPTRLSTPRAPRSAMTRYSVTAWRPVTRSMTVEPGRPLRSRMASGAPSTAAMRRPTRLSTRPCALRRRAICNGVETCDPVNDCQAGAPLRSRTTSRAPSTAAMRRPIRLSMAWTPRSARMRSTAPWRPVTPSMAAPWRTTRPAPSTLV